MRSYTPFMKLKVNEVGAIKALAPDLLTSLVPFFDLPQKPDMSEATFCTMVDKAAVKIKKLFGDDHQFYLDCFDIPDTIRVNGKHLIHYVAQGFSGQSFMPVFGFDRATDYASGILACKTAGLISQSTFALRLLQDDFESFGAVKNDIAKLLSDADAVGFNSCVLVIDMRFCLGQHPSDLAQMIENFIVLAMHEFGFSKIVVTGSSIPAKISDLVAPSSEVTAERAEISVFRLLDAVFNTQALGFGDYTIVSPLYTDVNMPPEMLRNVTAPKVAYTYDDVHFIVRGGALTTHPRGNKQYNDISQDLVTRYFFRPAGYSFGEQYLLDKASFIGKDVTPSTILKPTICSHMTYMVRDHSLFV